MLNYCLVLDMNRPNLQMAEVVEGICRFSSYKFFVEGASPVVGRMVAFAITTRCIFFFGFLAYIGGVTFSTFDTSRAMTALKRRIAEVFA